VGAITHLMYYQPPAKRLGLGVNIGEENIHMNSGEAALISNFNYKNRFSIASWTVRSGHRDCSAISEDIYHEQRNPDRRVKRGSKRTGNPYDE
jgi:hypothetical protein